MTFLDVLWERRDETLPWNDRQQAKQGALTVYLVISYVKIILVISLCKKIYKNSLSFLGSGNFVTGHELPGAHLPAGALCQSRDPGLPPLSNPRLQLQRLLPLLGVGVISVLTLSTIKILLRFHFLYIFRNQDIWAYGTIGFDNYIIVNNWIFVNICEIINLNISFYLSICV